VGTIQLSTPAKQSMQTILGMNNETIQPQKPMVLPQTEQRIFLTGSHPAFPLKCNMTSCYL